MNRDIAIFFIGVFVGVAVIGLLSLSIIKVNSEHDRAISQIENLREVK